MFINNLKKKLKYFENVTMYKKMYTNIWWKFQLFMVIIFLITIK